MRRRIVKHLDKVNCRYALQKASAQVVVVRKASFN